MTRKERWGLSWQGWLLLCCIACASGWLGALYIYPFLAVSDPVPTEILVVEGWVHDYASREVLAEFGTGKYRHVFVTGGAVAGSGGYTNDFNTYASVGAELLIARGLPRATVQMVPSRESKRDRTYSSALALGRFFQEKKMDVHAINVMTENAHARRSLILFQRALGPKIKVGVVPIANPDYDPAHWWRYSEGVRDVIGETLAYVYAKVWFSPEK